MSSEADHSNHLASHNLKRAPVLQLRHFVFVDTFVYWLAANGVDSLVSRNTVATRFVASQ
jgi:hypothetical protein